MKRNKFESIAQISTAHTSRELFSIPNLRETVSAVQDITPLSALIIGGQELPAVFDEVTGNQQGIYPDSYLWYNFLSDYPGQTVDESIIDFEGNNSSTWFGWGNDSESEVSETFLFSCPNNPETRQKSLFGLGRLLEKFPFNGVFLDKFRFPSPANGLKKTLSCFCPHCQEKAASKGLDLEQVRQRLANGFRIRSESDDRSDGWAALLTQDDPLLKAFLQFRMDSITEVVTEVQELTRKLGRKLGLDLFSPMLSDLVGQHYLSLAPLADWIKPMTYRYAMGPAGLRLEIQSLVDDMDRIGIPKEEVLNWAERVFPWFSNSFYSEMIHDGIPIDVIQREVQSAVNQACSAPVFMGLETVSFPGVIDMTPKQVTALVNAGIDAGADGFVFSWDLLHTPIENVEAIRAAYDRKNG